MVNAEFTRSPKAFLATEYGTVEATFTSDDWIYVTVGSESGQAHINDNNPALVFRGEEYIGSVGFHRDTTTGELTSDSVRVHFSRRANWTDAPKTYAAKMRDAIARAVTEYIDANPGVVVQGAYAETARELSSLMRDRAELAAKLAELDAKIAAETARQATLADQLGE